MNIDRVSPRQYQPAPERRVTFNPVLQVKTFRNSDPINATRPTIHASRLESALKTSPSKRARVEDKPEKPPPRVPYLTPETPEKAAGRVMAWCAIGSLALIPVFGPGALAITGICAFVSAIYFVRHNRLINHENYHENRTNLTSANRSISNQPREGTINITAHAHHAANVRQSPRPQHDRKEAGEVRKKRQPSADKPSHSRKGSSSRASGKTKRV